MRVYLDVCCQNRPFDDQAQDRVRLEAEAITTILAQVRMGQRDLVGSDAIILEVSRIPDPSRRSRLLAILVLTRHHVTVTTEIQDRAKALAGLGLRAFDALHVACAEASGPRCS